MKCYRCAAPGTNPCRAGGYLGGGEREMNRGAWVFLASCAGLIVILGPDLVFALRTGKAKVWRASPRRTISKEDRPRQYWANVYLMAAFVMLAAAGVIWVYCFPATSAELQIRVLSNIEIAFGRRASPIRSSVRQTRDRNVNSVARFAGTRSVATRFRSASPPRPR